MLSLPVTVMDKCTQLVEYKTTHSRPCSNNTKSKQHVRHERLTVTNTSVTYILHHVTKAKTTPIKITLKKMVTLNKTDTTTRSETGSRFKTHKKLKRTLFNWTKWDKMCKFSRKSSFSSIRTT